MYKPEEHGIWEIYENEFGGLGIRQMNNEENVDENDEVLEETPN